MNTKRVSAPAGGSFLLGPTDASTVLVPEGFDDELLAMAKTAHGFTRGEVIAAEREMESKAGKAARLPITLLRKAADLGFCMVDVPEEYGGLDLGVTASMVLAEKLSEEGAFSVTWSAHVGIGTLPIVYFGTPAQKEKYLPKLASAEWVGAYCLSEAGSGSDALGARTKAVLNEAGTHYVLNGTKMWISNGGWADSYIVFAKVDGDKFTGFIVERGFPGVSSGPEEHKLGLRGSSTTTVILEDAQVPVENVLGEVGKGHKIAFHILNVGRFKLGAQCIGGMKRVIEGASQYALERKQFDTPIAEFGAIREKLAVMAMRTWASESLVWRLAGYMEAALAEIPDDAPDAGAMRRAVIEEYGIESSIAKVYNSEALDRVIDEGLQIHGGYGFVEDFPIEKSYRDARVNRIFEGTNEINRLLIPSMIFKRAMRGRLGLIQAAQALDKELETSDFAFDAASSPLDKADHAAGLVRRHFLIAANAAVSKHGAGLKDHQEVVMRLADLAIALYAADSSVARARQLLDAGEITADGPQVAATVMCAADALYDANRLSRQTILACWEGDALASWLTRQRKLALTLDLDRIGLAQTVADDVVARRGYGLSNY